MNNKIENYYEKVISSNKKFELEDAAINIRHILEIILSEYTKKYAPEHFYDETFVKINILLNNEIISKSSANIFHELRKIGNKGAHTGTSDNITSDEIQNIIIPLRRIIDEFYLKIEGTNSSQVQNENDTDETEKIIEQFRSQAGEARANCDFDAAYRYTQKILNLNPFDSLATFDAAYYKALCDNDLANAAQTLGSCVGNVFSLINSEYPDSQNARGTIAQYVSEKVFETESSMEQIALDAYNAIPINNRVPYISQLGYIRASAARGLYNLGFQIEKFYPNNKELMILAINAWKRGRQMQNNALKNQDNKEEHRREMQNIAQKIKQYDTNYQTPAPSGCYVATAVYGSYDCPEVWTLRRFRDNVLALHISGRLFIKAYYAISPILVNVFGQTHLFNKVCKIPLDFLVNKLKTNGMKDTPYNDNEDVAYEKNN